jgi:hypothetical protein
VLHRLCEWQVGAPATTQHRRVRVTYKPGPRNSGIGWMGQRLGEGKKWAAGREIQSKHDNRFPLSFFIFSFFLFSLSLPFESLF